MNPYRVVRAGAAALVLFVSCKAQALVVQDNFTGASNQSNWLPVGNACLSASSTAAAGSGKIPGCTVVSNMSGGGYYKTSSTSLPDPVGNGALRFTSNRGYQRGGIIYNNWFPATAGIDVTWTSYTYGGNGADGMSFFLIRNPSDDPSQPVPQTLGASGGALGYACANDFSATRAMDGVANAYLGIGMDEFGNFTNSGDNGSPKGTYRAYSNAIGFRGGGNINAAFLRSSFPSLYPNPSPSDVWTACKQGYVDYGGTRVKLDGYSILIDPPYALPAGQKISATNVPWRAGAPTPSSNAWPVTYRLKITPKSLMSFSYSFNGGSWTQIANDVDLNRFSGAIPTYLTFGFAGSTGAATNFHEITCFKAQPQASSSSSATANTTQSSQIIAGTQLFLSAYHTDNWWGEVSSFPLVVDAANRVSVSTSASWNASCGLTGGTCDATGSTSAAQAPAARTILTWNGSQGSAFEWGALTQTQQTSLNASDGNGAARLAFLRGDRSQEQSSPTPAFRLFRTRNSVLGDVVNSSPVWVGPPSSAYAGLWNDSLHPAQIQPENSPAAMTYSTFKQSRAGRPNVAYVGSNDGMLHGFRAGAYTPSGSYSTSQTPNDGKEVLAYVPATVFPNLAAYTAQVYNHQYFVDAAPGSGDLFYANSWHTWLIGSMGMGGKGIYALDVTDPSESNFTEGNAGSLVEGEWSSANISCINGTACGKSLGYSLGTPVVTRFHNGQWGAVFGNGYDSENGDAALFVMLVDPGSGQKRFYSISTAWGANKDPTGQGGKNGILFATPVDLDGDNIADYVYAGDLFGNVWRFDLTDSDPAKWQVSNLGSGSQAKPLFSTPVNTLGSNGIGSKSLQPITTRIVAGPLKTSGGSRVMIYFGTGQKRPFTSASANVYATGSQAVYGIWDWNMAAWNALPTKKFVVPVNVETTPTDTLAATQLQTQSVIPESVTNSSSPGVTQYAALTSKPVCWAGSAGCVVTAQYGWRFIFPNATEQLLYNPRVSLGAVQFNSTIPFSNSAVGCDAGNDTGWSYALNPATGGNFRLSYFANDSNTFSGVSGYAINAEKASLSGSSILLTYAGQSYLCGQKTDGSGFCTQVKSPTAQPYRLTWIELR